MVFLGLFSLAFSALLFLGAILGFAGFFSGRALRQRVADLEQSQSALYTEISILRAKIAKASAPRAEPRPEPARPSALETETAHVTPTSPIELPTPPAVVPQIPRAAAQPPPLPEVPEPIEVAAASVEDLRPKPLEPSPSYVSASLSPTPGEIFDWERFTGVKLFSWIGGLALFFALAFFVKYSFDQGLISPPLRVALGLLFGISAIAGGLKLDREKFALTVQALTASGIAILYATIFGAHALYQLLPSLPTFVIMALVTATAFVLAVKLDARYVAAMGLLCGFLAPPLLSTGQDRPFGLFSYIALLDAGLLAVVAKKRWGLFAILSAIATIVMEWGWAGTHFSETKAGTGIAIFFFFAAAYTAARHFLLRDELAEWARASALILQASAVAFAWHLIGEYPEVARPGGLVLGYLVVVSFLGIALIERAPGSRRMYVGILAASFLGIVGWINLYIDDPNLMTLLAALLVFGGAHATASALTEPPSDAASEKNKTDVRPLWPLAIPFAVLLAFSIPLARDVVSILLWPALLVVNLIGLVVAATLGVALASHAFALVTMLLIAVWLGGAVLVDGPGTALAVVAVFGVFFVAAGAFLEKRLPNASKQSLLLNPTFLPALLPYFLLIQIDVRLHPENPSMLFAIATLFSAVLLALVRFREIDFASPAALLGLFLLAAFHQGMPGGTSPVLFAWDTAIPLVFLGLGLRWYRNLSGRVVPVAVSALAAPLFFYLGYRAAIAQWGSDWIGLLPALWSLPFLGAVAFLKKRLPSDESFTLTTLALFAGVALFFITLIFPLQFEKQWITISWALEAGALLWLHSRIPHRGLVVWATGLLAICFVRLAMNVEVIDYHPGPHRLLFNWFFYTYVLAAAAFFYSAGRLKSISDPTWSPKAAGAADTGAVILLFLLMNIEIGHAYRSDASNLFSSDGYLARDMTYSLGWALFAAALLAIGIPRAKRGARVGGLVLLSAACLKVFFHDVWRLGQLYRVGSFAGLAVIMILVSYFYQKVIANETTGEGGSEHGT
jgi:uncharacterized membrane protein